MASMVDVMNLGILKLASDKTISAVGEQSKEARVMNRLWEPTRRAVLADGMWPWATVSRSLALSASDPGLGYGFRYARPNDCLTAWAVTSAEGLRVARSIGGLNAFFFPEMWPVWGLPAWDFEQVYGDDQTEILTDLEQAFLIHTVDVTQTERFPPLFVDTLASALARDAAGAIIGEVGLNAKPRLIQEYQLSRSVALAHDLNEGRAGPMSEPVTPALRAR